jgi:acyl dehydratase
MERTVRYCYDDIAVGETIDLGETRVTADEIIAFARAFDPQPMHLDPVAARDTMVGELCASGFHSCAILMRLLCDSFLLHAASLGSPGMEEVRWLKPVVPERTMTGRIRCIGKRELASRPGVGLMRLLIELVDAEGNVLMSWDTSQFMRLRPSPSTAAARGG